MSSALDISEANAIEDASGISSTVVEFSERAAREIKPHLAEVTDQIGEAAGNLSTRVDISEKAARGIKPHLAEVTDAISEAAGNLEPIGSIPGEDYRRNRDKSRVLSE